MPSLKNTPDEKPDTKQCEIPDIKQYETPDLKPDTKKDEKPDIKSLSYSGITSVIESLGEKPFRADQVFSWLHEKTAVSFDEMSNLSKNLREALKNSYSLCVLKPLKVLESQRDETVKFLFELQDGETVESVLMKYEYGYSVCISSQVGCRMNCSFCATGKGGLIRNLSSGEMVEQIYAIERLRSIKISRVVIMGMGEPLDNFNSLLSFIELICHEKGRNLGQRHITVSTCGLAPNMIKLAEHRLQITLALSLHSAIDSKRSTIMPVNRAYPLEEVLEAAQTYYRLTKRRISFEYSLISGVNDTKEDMEALIKAAKRIGAHVNLIPVNPVEENRDFVAPKAPHIRNFQMGLEKSGINVTIRREMGKDINGACGQLRRAAAPVK